MIVTFISQCHKKALKRTRTILDSFARRIGERTWQTVITQEGLIAVKSLLKQSASKNTAISCHYSSGYKNLKLLWIIGNKREFDSQGAIPIATTNMPIINTELENNWHYLPLIKSLAAMASLLHDWGKASKFFQNKLEKGSNISDPLRHEWVSCLLFSAFVKQYDNDEFWLEAIIDGKLDDSKLKIEDKEYLKTKDEKCLKEVKQKDAAEILVWLILTHHRLPYIQDLAKKSYNFDSISNFFGNVTKEWGYAEGDITKINECLVLKSHLKNSDKWLKELKKWSKKLKGNLPLLQESISNGSYRLLLLYSRMSMMLGDHLYSSQAADSEWDKKEKALYANTDGERNLKQKLDEHLVGVSRKALEIVHLLPRFENGFEYCSDISSLSKKSKDDRFKWQDKAVSAISPFAKEQQGFFIVNMASTGCGKTLANAKIMNALSAGKLRYTLVLGLRSLTLQTGDEYRDKIKLDKTELAVIIGSNSHLELHNNNKETDVEDTKEKNWSDIGSESLDELSEDYFIDGDISSYSEAHFKTIIKNKKHEQLIYTPIVVCTIDHIITASEVTRGGKYILPTIRLMSADLVIDEIDDFDQEHDLVAIGRLIHLAGMLGRRVMISSATIPPSIAEGYFNVYKEGWKIFSQSRMVNSEVHCAWVDEFDSSVEIIKENFIESYSKHHEKFIADRVLKLKDQIVKRKGKIVKIEIEIDDKVDQEKYFEAVKQSIIEQHSHHSNVDEDSGKRISFGMVRMANIEPCINLTKYLIKTELPENIDVKVMAYHSKQVLLLRNHQERHLDAVLKRYKTRTEAEEYVFQEEFGIIKKHINNSKKNNIIFILVATPIEEVGRDHDFDFAVVEPSSMRSIIQLAGRVMRHRTAAAKHPNVSIMQYNLKRMYSKPGYESEINQLKTHNIKELLQGSNIENSISSIPRIQNLDKALEPTRSLIDLEHKVISDCLINYESIGAKTMQGWLKTCLWMSAASQRLARFRAGEKRVQYYLMPNEDLQENFIFHMRNHSGQYSSQGKKIEFVKDKTENDRLWLARDYTEILSKIAEQKRLSEKEASSKFGLLEVVEYNVEGTEYEYSQQFGLMKKKD